MTVEVIKQQVLDVQGHTSELQQGFKSLEDKVEDIDRRVIRLETKHDSLHDKVDSVLSILGWILKVVIGAIVAGMMGFILNGGLQIAS